MDSVSKFDLTIEELAILEAEMLKKKKSKEAAWGLWAGLSFFGAHRFYTENYRYASTMLLTSMIPIIAIMIILVSVEFYYGFTEFLLGFFIFLLCGSVIWSWIDAFFLNKRINDYNDSCENQILRTIMKNRK